MPRNQAAPGGDDHEQRSGRRPRHCGRSPGAGGRRGWRAANITPAKRLGRINVGLAAIATGAVLLAGAGPAPAVVLEALLEAQLPAAPLPVVTRQKAPDSTSA